MRTKRSPFRKSEKSDAISELLLEMVCLDGDAYEAETQHISHVLALRERVKDAVIQEKIDSFQNIKKADIEKPAKNLRTNLSSFEPIQILHDLWVVALANGAEDSYEIALFHKIGHYLAS